MSIKKVESGGFILIEILVAMTIFVFIASAVLGGLGSAREGKVAQKQNMLARGYLDQAVEAVRSVRERNWTLITNGTYYPSLQSDSTWALAPLEVPPADARGELIDGFYRKIVISNVLRESTDPSGDIVTTGGVIDPATKKVVISVSWGFLPTQSISTTYYLTRHKYNDRFEHTLVADFDDGRHFGTLVQDDNADGDGEVVLAPAGKGNWCNPSQSITYVDLRRQGVPTSVWAFESGDSTGTRVFAGTGENASSKSFTNTNVVVVNEETGQLGVTALGDFDGAGTKSNAIFGDEDYAYIATDKQQESLMILDLHQFSNPPLNNLYKKVGVYNNGDSKAATGVFVEGNTAYLTTNKLHSVNVSNKSSPTQRHSPVTLDGTASKIIVAHGIAYVAITGSNTKLQLFAVSDSSPPQPIGKLVNAGLSSVKDIYVGMYGRRVYLITGASATGPEFYIIDTSNPASPRLINGATYETGMEPTGITVVGYDSLAIIVGKLGSDTHPEYQVVRVWDETDVGLCTNSGSGTLRVSGGIHDVSSVLQSDGRAYSYVVTGDTGAELRIIEGGTGGGGGGPGSSGIFESELTSQLPFATDVQFNRFDVDADMNGGQLRIWVAVYQPVNGSCVRDEITSPYPYAGPDGTENTYYSGSGAIPFSSTLPGYSNPGKCIRYRIRFYSGAASPMVKSIKVNYSP